MSARRVLLLCAWLALGCGGGSPSQPTGKETTSDTSVPIALEYEVSLWNEFSNEAAGDLKYLGKTVEFIARGKVEKNAAGIYFIAGEVVSLPPRGTTPGVVCLVDPADVGKLAEAKPHQAFRIRGVCRGRRSDPNAWRGYSVTVENCRVLKVLTHADGKWQ
jgi:hypothetical protein